MESPSPPKLGFEPVDNVASATTISDEALLSNALARFEFESGRGNEGTKILMVEWLDENGPPTNTSEWEVSWEGKSLNLAARDGAEGKLHRIYFLLAPGLSVPRTVNISQRGGKSMQTNPLPAIFPPELGVSAVTQGRKGVLHTIWAKKRLSVLQKEIELEMQNGEGVGLGLALQEKQWIEDNFGVGGVANSELQNSIAPTSPTPGSRLAEKLKGLKLGTSASELSPSLENQTVISKTQSSHPLSPDSGDLAVSSFSLFHATPSQADAGVQNRSAHLAVKHSDSRHGGRLNSLDAIAAGHVSSKSDAEMEDELFAVKMSPRSPEMQKSPFSFTARDKAPWLKNSK